MSRTERYMAIMTRCLRMVSWNSPYSMSWQEMKSNMRILSLIVFSIMTCILFFFCIGTKREKGKPVWYPNGAEKRYCFQQIYISRYMVKIPLGILRNILSIQLSVIWILPDVQVVSYNLRCGRNLFLCCILAMEKKFRSCFLCILKTGRSWLLY